jgi:small ligand-binding sensory domain FIST
VYTLSGLTRLFCDDQVFASGAVGVRAPGLRVRPIVSQGCRPIGNPYTVTRAEGTIITELAGRPPLQVLEEILPARRLADGLERVRIEPQVRHNVIPGQRMG